MKKVYAGGMCETDYPVLEVKKAMENDEIKIAKKTVKVLCTRFISQSSAVNYLALQKAMLHLQDVKSNAIDSYFAGKI